MTCRESEPLSPLQAGADGSAEGPLGWLQSCAPQWVELHNRLHRHRTGLAGEFGGQPIGVRWASALQPSPATFDVHLSLDGAALMLQLPTDAVEVLTLGNLSPEQLKGLTGSMLVELALLELIEPLEQLSGHTLHVVDGPRADQPTTYPLSMMWQVHIAEHSPWAVPLHLSAEAARLVARLLEQYISAEAHALTPLHLPLTVDGGEAQLNIAELRSLRPGDVVMLDDWPQAQVRLVLDGRLQARAERNGATVTLLEQPIAVTLTKEHRMTESVVSASQSQAPGSELDATLDQLPLKLVCQVGSVELSLAQLRELGEGSLVQLSPQLDDRVDLMVNGRRLGQGQLVKIGDGLGVRLLSFATA